MLSTKEVVNNWKYFEEKDKDHLYAKYDATYGHTYVEIEAKMKKIIQNAEKGAIFSSILQSLKTLLPTNQARLWGINEVLKQNSFKNQHYRLEVRRLNAKLEQQTIKISQEQRWRWFP